MSPAGSLLGLFLLVAPAGATRDPPDYRRSLALDAAAHAEALSAAGHFDQAIALCKAYDRALGPAAEVLYEQAYAHNLTGKVDKARRLYDQALELDPELASARYDRAELLLGEGDLDAAEADLLVAARLAPDHWAVHLRLAEVAGRRDQPAPLEEHLMSALRNGLEWQILLQDPVWYDIARSEQAGPVLQRLISVYGDPAIFETLAEPVPH